METVLIDTIVEDSFIKIPRKFRNKRIKVILVDTEEREKGERARAFPRKLNFKIDESLEDVIPFSDVKDSIQFVEKLREKHWR
jgi:hypothetical protein